MADSIQQAIELFRLNLQALEFRERFYNYEQTLFDQLGWSFKLLSAPGGFAWQHKHQKAEERLRSLKARYERAISELNAGRTDFAIVQLHQMAKETLVPVARVSLFGRLRFNKLIYEMPKPVGPNTQSDAQAQQHSFVYITQLLNALSDPSL